MDMLLPLAKKVGEKLKARKETVGVSEVLGRRPDLGRAARGARRLGLFHGRRRGLHAPGRRGLPDRDALEARRHPLLLRAVGDACRRARARAAQHHLGPRRNRRRRVRPAIPTATPPATPASPSSAPTARSRAPCAPARTTASPTCAPSPPRRSSCWTSSCPSEPERAARSGSCPRRCRARRRCRHRR